MAAIASQDGTLLATGCVSGCVRLYRTSSGVSGTLEPVADLHGHRDCVSKVVLSNMYGVLLSASHDRTAIVWDVNTETVAWCLAPHESAVVDIAISDSTGDIVTLCHLPRIQAMTVSGRQRSALRLWSINSTPIGKVETPTLVTSVAMSSVPLGVFDNVLVAGCVDVSFGGDFFPHAKLIIYTCMFVAGARIFVGDAGSYLRVELVRCSVFESGCLLDIYADI
jgi:WD40 repeat protein